MPSKTVCVLSGGMDSTTLLYHLLDIGDETLAISFDYGQRHKKELEYAARCCRKLGVEDHKIIDLSDIRCLLEGSALTSFEVEVPDGHYQQETMMATVVPNRNMILMSIAGAYAISQNCRRLAVAVHAGDHALYPDCRPEFISSFAEALKAGNYADIEVYAPFLEWTKTEIAALGLTLGIDYDEETWSCYRGGEEPCGTCGTCVERKEALDNAG